MPSRQTIGISLALLMASSGAMAKAPDERATQQQSAPHKIHSDKTLRSARTRTAHKPVGFRWPTKLAFHRVARGHHRQQVAADTDAPLPQWGPMHTTGYQEIGEAAWYALVGARTSSGERLDTETPTAAHRTLPLGSCAKVTNLDTGRSVIVRINDRGPWTRRFAIDLSPRAAAELGMMHSGTAAVAIESVAPGAVTVAATPAAGAAGQTATGYRVQTAAATH
jgi:rare lipoprotein A (peptidoglycan hydrolase)